MLIARTKKAFSTPASWRSQFLGMVVKKLYSIIEVVEVKHI